MVNICLFDVVGLNFFHESGDRLNDFEMIIKHTQEPIEYKIDREYVAKMVRDYEKHLQENKEIQNRDSK